MTLNIAKYAIIYKICKKTKSYSRNRQKKPIKPADKDN